MDWDVFAPGLALAEAALPQPAVTPARPGVGFLIAHRGRTGNYTVLGWWDRCPVGPSDARYQAPHANVRPPSRFEGWGCNGSSARFCHSC
jgi:hypothetical protein